jgi:hypothetical protein
MRPSENRPAIQTTSFCDVSASGDSLCTSDVLEFQDLRPPLGLGFSQRVCHAVRVSAPDISADMMKTFANSGSSKHVSLLLGAGASSASGLPGWDELAVRLLLKSESVTERGAAERLVSRQDPLLVAEAARNVFGADWNRRVKAALYENLSNLSPSALHLAAASHALAGSEDDTTLMTLNFDVLLEDALRIDADPERVSSRVDEVREAGIHSVHHLHGIIAPKQNTRNVILTLSDFNEVLGNPVCWQQQILQSSAKQGAIVIAGTTYRDPDVRRWLHVALTENPGHAAIVLLARQAFGASPEEFTHIRGALAEQWSAAGLTPVILEDFTDAAQIIRELRHVDRAGYASPQERAQLVWQTHIDQFASLQATYSNQLRSDAEALREAFDVDALNVTLWLADAQGGLVKYAAQDRVYRTAEDLRHVPTGHDSVWIAGVALGAEDMVYRDLDSTNTSRWETVMALPIRVEHSGLPGFATAVLSIGLPRKAAEYASSQAMWFDTALDVANAWSEKLVQTLTV